MRVDNKGERGGEDDESSERQVVSGCGGAPRSHAGESYITGFGRLSPSACSAIAD